MLTDAVEIASGVDRAMYEPDAGVYHMPDADFAPLMSRASLTGIVMRGHLGASRYAQMTPADYNRNAGRLLALYALSEGKIDLALAYSRFDYEPDALELAVELWS